MKHVKLTEHQIENLLKRILINEGGIRDIKKLAQRYPKAEIYFTIRRKGIPS